MLSPFTVTTAYLYRNRSSAPAMAATVTNPMTIITRPTLSTSQDIACPLCAACAVSVRGARETARTDSQTEEGQLSMVKSLTRIGDRILERVVPKTTASAACGNYLFCYCVLDLQNNTYTKWFYRVDAEHQAYCQLCQSMAPC